MRKLSKALKLAAGHPAGEEPKGNSSTLSLIQKHLLFPNSLFFQSKLLGQALFT